MNDTSSFPYETRLNVLYGPLQVIDEQALADSCEYKWYNQTLCRVNDSVVRMAVIEGEYHWHKHEGDDEFFYVVEGQLLIDLDGPHDCAPAASGFRCLKGCCASYPGFATHRNTYGRNSRYHSDRGLSVPAARSFPEPVTSRITSPRRINASNSEGL